MKNRSFLIGDESDYAKWCPDSCGAITRANHPPLVPRGGLWAPIVRDGDVVRGAGMEIGMGKPTVRTAF